MHLENSKKIMTANKTNARLKELERLVSRKQDTLFRFAYMRVGDRQDAEDIVQDVFLKFFRSDHNLGLIRNLENYLLRSVGNACYDWLRRKKYNLLPLKEAKGIIVPDEDRQIHEEYLRISKMLESLPEEQAEIVRLKCSDGLKFREIAKLLEIPEATAKSRYRYAIAHIQKNINN